MVTSVSAVPALARRHRPVRADPGSVAAKRVLPHPRFASDTVHYELDTGEHISPNRTCHRRAGGPGSAGRLRRPRRQPYDGTTDAESDDPRPDRRGSARRRAIDNQQSGVPRWCADPSAVHLQGGRRSATVDVVGAVGGGTRCRRPGRPPRALHPLDRGRNPSRPWEHRGWSDPRWRKQPAELGRPGRVRRAVPACRRRGAPLPIHPLPASRHIPAPSGTRWGASGAGDNPGRIGTSAIHRNGRRLTQ
jgi:hypothetical protein